MNNYTRSLGNNDNFLFGDLPTVLGISVCDFFDKYLKPIISEVLLSKHSNKNLMTIFKKYNPNIFCKSRELNFVTKNTSRDGALRRFVYSYSKKLNTKQLEKLNRDEKIESRYTDLVMVYLENGFNVDFGLKMLQKSKVIKTPTETLCSFILKKYHNKDFFYEEKSIMDIIVSDNYFTHDSFFIEDKNLKLERYLGEQLFEFNLHDSSKTEKLLFNVIDEYAVFIDHIANFKESLLEAKLLKYEPYFDNFVKEIGNTKKANNLISEYKKNFSSEFELIDKRIMHSDLNPGNIVVKDGIVSIIDFENVSMNYLEYDLVKLLQKLMLPDDLNNSVKDYYFNKFALNSNQSNRIYSLTNISEDVKRVFRWNYKRRNKLIGEMKYNNPDYQKNKIEKVNNEIDNLVNSVYTVALDSIIKAVNNSILSVDFLNSFRDYVSENEPKIKRIDINKARENYPKYESSQKTARVISI